MFDHGYAKPNTPVISVYRQHTPEVVPERHIKERRGAQAGSCDGALNITPPGHYTPPGAAPSLRPAICSTSSPWHKSSTGCETRRMRHRDTETQRISRFSPCLCGRWLCASQAVSTFTTASWPTCGACGWEERDGRPTLLVASGHGRSDGHGPSARLRPVAMLSACRRWKKMPEALFVFATEYIVSMAVSITTAQRGRRSRGDQLVRLRNDQRSVDRERVAERCRRLGSRTGMRTSPSRL